MKKDNIKYTTDGRKVVVIGDLNQTEKIVQEIFVTDDGAEIPSGERFTAKSLHDTPVKSWKEKNLDELESRFERERKMWDDRISDIQKEKSLVYDSLKCRVKWLKQVAKEPHPESLRKVIETLALFLSNTDMWVFYKNYSGWYLEKYDQEGFNRLHDQIDGYYGNPKIKGMRLVSIYGNSEGCFDFKINSYGDGSGNDTSLLYFKSKEDALKHIQNEFDLLEKYNDRHIDIAKEFNLRVDEVKFKAYNDSIKESIIKQIKEYQSKVAKYETKLKNLD